MKTFALLAALAALAALATSCASHEQASYQSGYHSTTVTSK